MMMGINMQQHSSEKATTGAVVPNDFHTALLWLRSLEIVNGHSPALMLSEIEVHDLFKGYHSPYKA